VQSPFAQVLRFLEGNDRATASPAGSAAAAGAAASADTAVTRASGYLGIDGPGIVETQERDDVGGLEQRIGRAMIAAERCKRVENHIAARIFPLLPRRLVGPQRHSIGRRGRIRGETKNIGPLLDGFAEVLVADDGIGVAVEELHARAVSGVPRVHPPSEIPPLLCGHDVVAACARAAPTACGAPSG